MQPGRDRSRCSETGAPECEVHASARHGPRRAPRLQTAHRPAREGVLALSESSQQRGRRRQFPHGSSSILARPLGLHSPAWSTWERAERFGNARDDGSASAADDPASTSRCTLHALVPWIPAYLGQAGVHRDSPPVTRRPPRYYTVLMVQASRVDVIVRCFNRKSRTCHVLSPCSAHCPAFA